MLQRVLFDKCWDATEKYSPGQMDLYDVDDLKWDDLIMVEARVTRYNSDKNGQKDKGKRSVNEAAWIARYDLICVNVLRSSSRKQVTKAPAASISI